MNTIHHVINGQHINGHSTRYGDVFNPATGESSKKVVLGTDEDLNAAVAAAKQEQNNTPCIAGNTKSIPHR